MKKTGERDIVQGVIKRDPEYLERLTELYYGKVYSLAMKLLNDTDEACDICQDTFLKILEHIRSFQYRSSLKTWILRITYHLCLKRLEKLKRKIPFDSESEHTSELNLITEVEQYDEEMLQNLSTALNRLSSEEKLLIELFYLNESSIREMAFILGKSETAVKTALFRARTRLRLLLLNKTTYEQF